MNSISRLCSIEGCGRSYEAQGLCSYHYHRARKTGEIGVVRPNHGMYKTPAYSSWQHMIHRCYGQNYSRFRDYGGRGIKVCARYRISFVEFYKDLGERPKDMTLDRRDSNGNYSCGKCEECIRNGWVANCRWSTATLQTHNRNMKPRANGLRGVYRQGGGYRVKIAKGNTKLYVGFFSDPDEAAWMYDQWALSLYEDDAHLNFEYCPVMVN